MVPTKDEDVDVVVAEGDATSPDKPDSFIMTKNLGKFGITKKSMRMVKPASKKRKVRKVRTAMPTFGPVTTVNTAPVAIGNSIHGSAPRILATKTGVRAIGRDFMFAPIGSNTVTTWTVVGGTPLTPAAFSDSTLRQYLQMYQKFKWRKLIVHYITSSPTSANGDIVFYHQKNRDSVFLSQTSPQFLPFIMSDGDTVLGPQWTNHSAELTIRGNWLSTDYGMSSVLDDFAEGDIFLLSHTTTTDSPGYVIFDYDVEFDELQISPRLNSLPITRAQWFNTSLGGTITGTTGNIVTFGLQGNNLSGNAAASPTGLALGDVYKIIFDLTNSPGYASIPGVASFVIPIGGGTYSTVPVVDGTTCYAVVDNTVGSPRWVFFPNVESAVSNGAGFLGYSANVGAVTLSIQVWMSLVTTLGTTNMNPNY